ncbi:MAG: SDR family oxidoreductase [Candidatus Ornithospirochaeta sp.]
MVQYPEERRSPFAYPISKNFVIWYTGRMAVENASRKIRVVSIAPGIIRTDMSVGEASSIGMAMASPAGRMAEPEEIARFMEYMIRDDYLNGVDILYDGGTISGMRAKQGQ